ncbi:tyrosine-type recombinase/integrase [Hominifimenecus sp. rT4P-3]|uniref:tyrosine-type recombinase/integrase n=1 Tax=Hominifimenecus sp. rT4P-3 TaxID=3242979 RepID=UPI003DA59D33
MSSGQRSYHEQVDILNTLKLRELTATLPSFVRLFFRGIEPTTSSRTRIAYAYDLHVFFEFLIQNLPAFQGKTVTEISVEMLDEVKSLDLEDYMEYLKFYHCTDNRNMERVNQERGITRKMASLKTFYNYFFKKEMIQTNPAALVTLPKIHEKEIIRLDIDEVAILLDQVESGENLTKQQKAFHEKTKIRDLAMMTLFLGTGIRVSECIGLNIDDLDFKNAGIHIHRKGGKEVIIYFSDEVEEALRLYYEERKKIIPATGHEDAFFLSIQKKRMSVRSVENLVKKYARTVTTLKNITPHKLRSTYGTNLYRETGDIYLVADVLGHSDVNTTKKHYAAMEDERRRQARNVVKLRENPEAES